MGGRKTINLAKSFLRSSPLKSMEKINKLSLQATILLAVVIFATFYFITETSKQKSIERQQEAKIADEKRIEDNAYSQKAREDSQRNLCVDAAQNQAQESYKSYCTKENYCTYKTGQFLPKEYNSFYAICLQRFGLK
jgi:hypothetical protein